ncbi:M48 family metallopeptidase [Ramlibacter tataouinensis]|uniref:Metal-dependent hydrolase n=1 Tax=Ramlibacter tataouinensis TaxID=94132 RepID=A0A127JU71_9BURK|nr:SprT family zinc-dependent metalloprotease [Ramlibacter tataouinensis]AMO23521.1 metal-dependent hydrolase [Ramlibacter tataouinensis]
MHRLLQLTLDFFDSVDAAPVPGPKTKEPRKRPAEPPSAAPTTPAPRLDEILQPASFRHPRANREAVLGDSVVAFEFRRAKRRNIGFMVGPEGLTVSAPNWVPLYEVDAAVRSKSPWILRKLGDAHERQQRVESARIDWREGATFPYLGEPVSVVLDPRHAFKEVGGILQPAEGGLPGEPRHALHIGLPHHAEPAQIRDAAQAWLMRQAKRVFTERLDHIAPQLAVRWRKLVLSNAGTRWGTAHSDGLIRLNWRLIHFRLPVIDYVVAHELSHLRVMDHSPRFWDTVATVVPDYAQLRGQLKDEALPTW